MLRLNKLRHSKLYKVNIVRTNHILSKLLYLVNTYNLNYFHLSKRFDHPRTNNKRMFACCLHLLNFGVRTLTHVLQMFFQTMDWVQESFLFCWTKSPGSQYHGILVLVYHLYCIYSPSCYRHLNLWTKISAFLFFQKQLFAK